jgi:hypothetical protein
MRLLACAIVVLTPALAWAQSRPASQSMSCDSARATVQRQGAVVLSTGPSTYDRYVASQAFCTPSEMLEPSFVPAADGPQCFVGYRCREKMGPDQR